MSELVLQEAALGDPELIQRRLGFLSGIPKLAITEPAQELARALLRPGLLPPNAAADALHISVAAANGMDYLLTWNIRHLANATLRRGIDEACRARGWVAPVVCTPEELLEG